MHRLQLNLFHVYILEIDGIECSFTNQGKEPLKLFCVSIISQCNIQISLKYYSINA